MATLDPVKMKRFAAEVIHKAGLHEEASQCFADSLVNADMRGVHSHGVTRLSTYVHRIHDGLVAVDEQPCILADAGALLLLDARNTMGVPAGYRAMSLCIERAAQYGVAFASVRGGNHFGYAAYYTELAASKGMIGFALSNGPAAMAPTGGTKAVLGTNPISIAVPAKKHQPLVLDMATSVVARGKVTLAKKEGRSIPDNWGIDADGKPTTDPAAVVTVLPFGGVKGYAISLITELLCSCLSGAKNGQTMGSFYDFSGTHQDVGFFFGAIDPSGIVDSEAFENRVDERLDAIKACPKAAGCDEIFIPGEIEFRNMVQAEKNGIDVGDAVQAELYALSKEYGVPFDCAMV